MPVFARLLPIRVSIRVRVSFTTGAVWSAIVATGGLVVEITVTVNGASMYRLLFVLVYWRRRSAGVMWYLLSDRMWV